MMTLARRLLASRGRVVLRLLSASALPSYSRGRTQPPLLDLTIGCAFRQVVSRVPAAPAVTSAEQGLHLTYQQLSDAVQTAARALLAAGVKRGDRVGILSPNNVEWLIVQLSTAAVGAILVNINPAYRLSELIHAVNISGLSLLFAAESFKTSDYRAMLQQGRESMPSLRRTVFIGSRDWEEAMGSGEAVAPDAVLQREEELSCTDPINIQFTSGTTALPKGATLSHRNILNNAFHVGSLLNYTSADRICIPVPFMYHCFGMVMGNLGALCHGASVVYPAPSFHAAKTLRALVDEKCTGIFGVPTMFTQMITEHGSAPPIPSLRTGLMAGSSCPEQLMLQVMNQLGAKEVGIAYGMTETSPVSCQTLITDDIERRTRTVGCAHPHVELRVVDPASGAVLDRGQPGELQTKGYSVMLGYWGDEKKTRECISSDGWMATGDAAVMRSDGYVSIVGRIKDMIIRGGENISPREIEEVLHCHPAVLEAQVIGVPDSLYGEQVMAWLIVRGDRFDVKATEDSLRKHCAELAPRVSDAARCNCNTSAAHLSHFKVPKYFQFTKEFPVTVTGKVRKVELREAAKKLLGIDS